ncbi:PP2C family protein-serine/threonine phosphatase [Salinibacterium sp. PAMC 21357]|uniref:PP2C family protein-serine/threonine phosphatase n=1 Tax=Salinibacterium sp. PAMC 21357 TaxID=1112215 RepID=UPI00028889DE|nr:protein phosphatase 2C domain-containing protein [Salinibacterium sp. PAMC 21357]
MTRTHRVGGVTLSVGVVTDVGMKRQLNEDSYVAQAPIYVVADGMGGYEAGDRASSAVVDAFETVLRGNTVATVELISAALERADELVAAVAGTTSRGAGSTVTGAAIVDHDGVPSWLVFNVGDSRVYRNIGSLLQQITVDHSLGQELFDAGELTAEEFASFPDRNVITRAIGAPDSTADSWITPIVNGERLLICSDGLTSEVADETIRASLTMGGVPDSVAWGLVDLAKRAGGKDNITVIVIDVISGGGDVARDGSTGSWMRVGLSAEDENDETTIPVGRR